VPLLRSEFRVNIAYGYADVVIHQHYRNITDEEIPIYFIIPYSETFTLQKIFVDFYDINGNKRDHSIETEIVERKEGHEKCR
jgi:hypothetical protein